MRATELFVGGWNEEGDRLGRMRSDTARKRRSKKKTKRSAHGFPKTSHRDRRPVLSAKKNLGYARMHEKKNKSANWDLR